MDLPIFGRRKVIQGVVRNVLVVVAEPDFGVLRVLRRQSLIGTLRQTPPRPHTNGFQSLRLPA